ncbi:HNH endonuclease [Cellulomonas composti]|uniref:HNH nuclease domain-containing protein n=1 Tax=Cellulomonas composti TaxID=266130 RepID=A0A511J9R0_9CELL|nr:HNH endonuclease signature motif containing protein [Cellulomonas composti]GEL94718.1 hypothetical protein CCO02nite_13760 [Cellulomonas composti]
MPRAPLLVARALEGAGATASDRSYADTRARETRSSSFQAARELAGAQALASMPGFAAAVADGRVHVGFADQLARVVADASVRVRTALASPEGEVAVLAIAARSATSTQFGRELAVLAAELDPESLDDDRKDTRRARFFRMSHSGDSTLLRGRVDAVTGRRLQLALESTGHRPDEDRDRGQANADALASLAEHTLACHGTVVGATGADAPDAGAAPSGVSGGRLTSAQNRPNVTVLMDLETLAALRARRTGAGADADRTPPATTLDGVPLSATELARVLCDCELTRLVVDAEGMPLDVGRTQRLDTAAQRRAVIARDRHCGWNGCDAPAHWCEVHHITWWSRGGTTDVDGAVLLCSHHHHVVHELDLRVTRLTPTVAPPRDRPHHDRPTRDRPPRDRPRGERVRAGATYTFAHADGRLENAPPDAPGRPPW